MPKASPVRVLTADGKELGVVTMIGRGGLQVQQSNPPAIGSGARLTVVDPTEEINRSLDVIARNVTDDRLVGYEFQNLDADAAVEIGVIIGKYYAAGAAT